MIQCLLHRVIEGRISFRQAALVILLHHWIIGLTVMLVEVVTPLLPSRDRRPINRRIIAAFDLSCDHQWDANHTINRMPTDTELDLLPARQREIAIKLASAGGATIGIIRRDNTPSDNVSTSSPFALVPCSG